MLQYDMVTIREKTRKRIYPGRILITKFAIKMLKVAPEA